MTSQEMKRKTASSHDVSESKRTKKDSIVEQDFINYISIPPLESIAISNVAIGLCNQTDIRDAIRQHSLKFDPVGDGISCKPTCHYYASFDELQKNILKNLSLVPLPIFLKEKVANVITPVLLQILEWIRHGRKDTEYMDSVCWTVHGTIDKVKTFEQLVSKDLTEQYATSFYELACTYCLEHSIRNLWEKLSAIKQDDYGKRLYRKYENHIIAYWTSIVKNELSELLSKIKPFDEKDIYNRNNSIYRNMFELGIYEGNVLAVKYFWYKLSAIEISCNLEQWIKNSLQKFKKFRIGYQSGNSYSDVLFFLLSQMEGVEQQNEVFRKNSLVILTSLFTDWPWQRFFLPTVKKIWSSLDENVYKQLLLVVAHALKPNKIPQKLLRKFWHDSPLNFKKCFIEYISSGHLNSADLLCNLMAIDDAETIKLMLNYANVEEKRKIMFNVVKSYNMYCLIHTDKLSLFDALIRENLSSDSDIDNLYAEIVLKYGNRVCSDWIYHDNFKMSEKFLKCAFTSQDEIANFKNNMLDKIEITYGIIKYQGNFDLVDKFLSWVFSTEEEMNQFKKKFAKSKYKKEMLGWEGWSRFQKFIHWCFISDKDINNFKCNILKSKQIFRIILNNIGYDYNFEFFDKLLIWCCQSNKKVRKFKTQFLLSDDWLSTIRRFVDIRKGYDIKYDNWTLTRKLIKLFFPVDEEVILKLKELITKDFDDYRPDYRGISPYLAKEDLFDMMDNYNTNDDIGTDTTTQIADDQN